MKTNNNGCVCGGCATTGTVLGIIFGIIVGALFAFGYTPLIVTGIWIVFGLAAAVLLYIMGVILLSSCDSCCKLYYCLCRNIKCLLVGAIGTLISTLAALSIVLLISVTAMVVLIAVGAFFFVFMITGLVYFIRCVVRCSS